jgi:hypothetical protein
VQYDNVVEQTLNTWAAELRFDRVRVVRGQLDVRELSFDRHNWTMYSLTDANGCDARVEGARIAKERVPGRGETVVSGASRVSERPADTDAALRKGP